ncbi:element excision factor XisH family protein [Dolichospermum circinale CS-534/05]|uniref:element excision factor XisH family protein n=1 Tax=Dolichospermum circinale TaxID=109265 RepID=UPI00232B1DD4|nr:element excision factor XisH family protein [Dolichospermum circinale]MDB9456039.1 element excision factor XisH family protein [Dolichospermum circinale CS-541/06]MDB9461416.1 element excision factor XisH family protein [Dolichospermum circinale CS-541/04]MDB9489257.1 element excision factor XisH family protein [Dolichospermum circinale CS-534/05]MDB9549717.1 element excision factor XisH family protein [Dolichospermum circinale CS-1031]
MEVKSFLNSSFIYDLERAVGQYIIYRNYLKRTAPDHHLWFQVGWTTEERIKGISVHIRPQVLNPAIKLYNLCVLPR